MENRSIATVDNYIRSFSGETRKKLIELRKLVRTLAPEALEKISYGMPGYFMNGNLLYFAAYGRHIGLYPGAAAIGAFKDKLSKYKYGKGSIQLPLDEKLPTRLIQHIVKFRIERNLEKRMNRAR